MVIPNENKSIYKLIRGMELLEYCILSVNNNSNFNLANGVFSPQTGLKVEIILSLLYM